MRSFLRSLTFVALILSTAFCFGQAPTITYSTPQSYLINTSVSLSPSSNGVAAAAYSGNPVLLGSGFSSPTGVAVDVAGNVYVSSFYESTIKKIPAGSNTPVLIGSGFTQPFDVTVDAAGNIYVADLGNNAVKKIPAGSNTPATIGSGFTQPAGVAVDAAGNIYIADYGHSLVKKIPAGSNSPISIGSGFSNPTGVAVDAFGNVYIADYGNNAVKKISAGSNTPVIIGTGISLPNGVAVDASGNVFEADYGSNTVKEILAGTNTTITLNSGAINPYKVTLDGSGNLFVADFSSGSIKKVIPSGGYYINKPLPAGLTFNNNTGVISGTPTVTSPATVYTITAYNSYGGTPAHITIKVVLPQAPTISYTTPQSYLINTAVKLSPSSSDVAAQAYGSNPAVLGSGFSSPTGVAVDVAGNVYVSSFYESTIKKIPAGSNTPVLIGSGLTQPFDVTVDAAGNIYVADLGNNAVKKIPAGSNTPVIIGSGFSQPAGVAVDAAGNIYIADYGHSLVKKIPAGSNSPISIGSGFATPTGVAVDAYGNIYIADYGNNAIKKIPAGSNTPVTIGSGISLPNGVAVDASGNVFEADYGTNTVKEILAGTNTTITLNSGAINPYKVALDGSGNLFIADFSSGSIKKSIPSGGYYIDKPLPAGLTFNNATGIISGVPTVASPATTYTVTAYNTGGGTATTINIKIALPPAPSISYNTPQNYVINAPVSLSPSSSNVASAAYSGNPVFLGSGFSSPSGVSVDAAGNVYVSSFYESTIKKIPAGSNTPVLIGSGLTQPFDVTIDAAGNIYVADLGNNAVKKIPAGSNTPVIIGSGFTEPAGVAVDAAGNIFIADYGNNAVKKIPAGSNTPVTIGSGFATPTGVAVDAYGNVYIADYGNNAIKKIPAGSNTPVTIGSGISLPNGVAVDASGNVFEADYGTNTVKEILAGTNTTITLNSGAINPYKVALDGSGNLFVADFSSGSIKKVIPSGGYYISKPLPAGLTFNNNTGSISGAATVASPATIYTVTAYNTGGGTTANVSIQVNAVASANAYLSTLTLNGTLSPAFVKTTYAYTVDVDNSVSQAFLTPTVASGSSITVNGLTVASGVLTEGIPLSVGPNTIKIIVTAQDNVTKKTYTITVTRALALSNNAVLASLNYNPSFTRSVVSGPDYKDYTGSVTNDVTTVAVIPTAQDAGATIKVNGVTVISGKSSAPIPLNIGANTINTVVKSSDGTVTNTYHIIITRISNIATLANLTLSVGTLSPAFASGQLAYNASVSNTTTSLTITPTTTDNTATLTVNGKVVLSGAASSAIALNTGNNTITTIVKAQDGTTTATYTVTVNRALSANARLLALVLSSGTLSPTFTTATFTYTASVTNTTTSITVKPSTSDPGATIKVNGVTVASGMASGAIGLVIGPNSIKTVVTAPDGVSTKTYTVTVTRAAVVSNAISEPVAQKTESFESADEVNVHQAVSPNGDGQNDVFTIDGIANYPDNNLKIMNRGGTLVFEANGYDNSTKVFDGHSNKNGRMQLPGTYFYSLDFIVKGVKKHKAGYIVLKY